MKRNITQMFKEIRDSQSEIREHLTAIQSDLSEVLEHLQNLDTLAEKRERDRLRKRRVRGQKNVRGQKEQEKGKRDIPPTPPIEKRAKEEESQKNTNRARAKFQPPTLEEATAFCRANKLNIDPSLWWHYYASRDWHLGLKEMTNWQDCMIAWDRKQRNKAPKRTTARKIEWVDPKVAAFERQQAENERRDREVNAMLDRMVAERSKLIAGDVS